MTVKTKLVYLFFAGRGAFILSPDKLLFHHKNKSILKVQLKKSTKIITEKVTAVINISPYFGNKI